MRCIFGYDSGGLWEKQKESEEEQPWTRAKPPIGWGFELTKKTKKITRVPFPLLCLLAYADMSKQPSTPTVMPSLPGWADYTLKTSAKLNLSSTKFLLLRYFATEVRKYLIAACGWGMCSWAIGVRKYPPPKSLIIMGKLRQFCLFRVPLSLAPLDLFNAENFLINHTFRDIISGS